MCCLKYEQEVYEDKIKKLPKVGSIVKTEDGEGTVVTQEVLKEAIKVQFTNCLKSLELTLQNLFLVIMFKD